MKEESGQSTFETPKLIIDNNKHITSLALMAAALNHQYIQKIRKTIA